MSKAFGGIATSLHRDCAAARLSISVQLLGLCLLSLTGVCTAANVTLPLHVFVSVAPQKTFVTRIAGDRAQVGVMVQPGNSPHTYEPTPRQMAALADADIYFRIGGVFEQSWMDRIRSANSRMKVSDLRAGIPLRSDAEQPHGGLDHGAGAEDFHIWTSPRLVIAMAARIRDDLSRLDPIGAPEYEANYQAFAADLRELDSEIRRLLASLKNRSFLVFHPAWGYFADEYGLRQIAVEVSGKTPGAAALGRLIEWAKQEEVRAIFVQRQHSTAPAMAVARAIDAQVIRVDPLAEDYAASLLHFARSLREAMQ